MGAELGAFGIYRAARPPSAAPSPWGVEGYRDGTVAAAWKGPVYVHGEADDDRSELISMLERLVSAAAARIPGEAAMPAALAPLPVAGRVARSERWVPADVLGHAFLPGGVLASYEVDDRRAELFVSDLGSEAAARDALQRLRDHFASSDRIDGEAEAVGRGGFKFTDPVLGHGTATRIGHHVAGIFGDMTSDEREAILGALVASLD